MGTDGTFTISHSLKKLVNVPSVPISKTKIPAHSRKRRAIRTGYLVS
jgi:hypothetical protein